MKTKLFLVLLSLFQTINLRYEKDGFIIFNLSGDMNRDKYILKSNENNKFINSDPKYIYFLETQEDIIFTYSNYHNSKYFACLPKQYDNIFIDKKYDSDDEIIIYVTSISNYIKL